MALAFLLQGSRQGPDAHFLGAAFQQGAAGGAGGGAGGHHVVDQQNPAVAGTGPRQEGVAQVAHPLGPAQPLLVAGGPVAQRSDDAEFFRRVQLDISGTIPTASEVRAFLKNKSLDKRTRLIDQLLTKDTFAAHWTDRLTVMLLERKNLGLS